MSFFCNRPVKYICVKYPTCFVTVIDIINSHVFMRPKFLIVFLNFSLPYSEFLIQSPGRLGIEANCVSHFFSPSICARFFLWIYSSTVSALRSFPRHIIINYYNENKKLKFDTNVMHYYRWIILVTVWWMEKMLAHTRYMWKWQTLSPYHW